MLDQHGDLWGFPQSTIEYVGDAPLRMVNLEAADLEASSLEVPELSDAQFIVLWLPGFASYASDERTKDFVARIERAGFDWLLAISEPSDRDGLRILFERTRVLERLDRRRRATMLRFGNLMHRLRHRSL